MLIAIHLGIASLALILASINLIREKGTPQHKTIGWIWIVSMTIVCVGSFWIRDLNPGQLSWIHGLSVFTLLSLIGGVVAIKRGHVRAHRGFMIGTYLGLLIAGGFAFTPGRFLSTLIGY